MRSTRAFTLMEVLVVISIIALLLAILIPGLSLARQTVNKMKSKTQLRAIQNSFVAYADKNNDWYPGLTSDGAATHYDYFLYDNDSDDAAGDGIPTTEPGAWIALWLLLREAMLVPEDLVSPVDIDTGAFIAENFDANNRYEIDLADPDGLPLDDWGKGNYSYATLEIRDPTSAGGERRRYWRNNFNAKLPVAGDRAIDNDIDNGGEGEIRSVHTNPDPDVSDWFGLVAWNDGHVTDGTEFVTTRLTDEFPNSQDDLFDDGASVDVLLQHSDDPAEY